LFTNLISYDKHLLKITQKKEIVNERDTEKNAGTLEASLQIHGSSSHNRPLSPGQDEFSEKTFFRNFRKDFDILLCLEISVIAVVDVGRRTAYTLSAMQTPPSDTEETRYSPECSEKPNIGRLRNVVCSAHSPI